MLLRPTRLIALLLALTAGAAAAAPQSTLATPAPAVQDDDDAGALIGDLVFHADLLTALDRLCPARSPGTDWHGAMRKLLDQAFTPELRELSQRLSADAGRQILQQRGGCHTRGYAAAYRESQDEYRALLTRWKALDD